ncbi:hypothetical protein Si110_00726 [Streptococcus infantarius subsp. infantarius]|nr:hypothetical protein [Streptococcus infantarius subsp. infantarius]MCO4513651.1 hypothetical protein [Streptococcus infantarius subsp. infantarius]MCO4515480.1 hypothetical protein [Streptococcus infantarius subsp. infantarius]
MNKQEVVENIKKIEGLNILDKIINFDSEMVSKKKVLDIVKQLDEPEKPVVPQFVAEWIESQKESFSDASAIHMYDNLTLDNSNGYYHEVWLWVIAHHHDFIKAWHDGYTVEQEKLYTVEIPNPNEPDSGHIVLHKDEHNKVYIDWHYEDDWKLLKSLKLTEAEIKEDFDWAWQFAEEVKE